jgi:glutamate/tyrosine decarboxylase-like PLP-dependent enzyme
MSLPEHDLDPENWLDFRGLARELIDTTVADLEGLSNRHGWRPPAEMDKAPFRAPLPRAGKGLRAACDDFMRFAKPFPMGQNTARYWGWAGGAGTADGVLASLMNAAFHSPNIIHHHAGTWIEMQVLDWLRDIMGFPEGTHGNLTSGCSLANFSGLAVARHVKGGGDVRSKGVGDVRFTVYGSAATHYSIPKSLDLLGLGSNAFRKLPVDTQDRIDLRALEAALDNDTKHGCRPICIVGNAGSVATGAIDPLKALAGIARRRGLWFHVDGAFGAIVRFSARHRDLLEGMESADSLAFDLHKWLSQPYEAGCILIADGQALEDTFAFNASYTSSIPGSLTDTPVVFANRGPEQSRALRALPFWISIKAHGADKFGAMVDKNIAQARYLEGLVRERPSLEPLSTSPLSVVNFRYRGTRSLTPESLNVLNRRLVAEIQLRGIAIPSSETIRGNASIRVCNLNHRSRVSDFDALVESVESIGRELEVSAGRCR